MPYVDIPQASLSYVDGAFKTVSSSNQPKILILGSASSGRSYEMFNVADVAAAEREFGHDSEMMKAVHQALAQGADNISLMRVGGTQSVFEAEENTSGEFLTITPESRDDEILERYNLIMEENPTGEQRILIWDNINEEFIYDTLEELAINTEVIRVENNLTDLYSIGDRNLPADAIALADIVFGDFTALGIDTISAATATAGTDGTNVSLPEKYAALANAYHMLDFQDADFVIPAGVYADDANQSDGSDPDYSAGVPAAGSADDALGLVWHYIYQGKLYTYMVEDSDVIDTDSATREFGITTAGRVTVNADAVGPAGENVRIRFMDTGAVVGAGTPAVVTVSGNDITVDIDNGVSLVSDIVPQLNAVTPGAIVTAISTVAGAFTADSLGIYYRLRLERALSHFDLTGDEIPDAVVTAWRASVLSAYRETNFAHQLAVFCWLASTVWKTMVGFISMKGPGQFDRVSVADWVGDLPVFTSKGTQSVVDVSGDNGTGLLGFKFLAGEHSYRNGMVEDGDANDGLAYGGFILTKGTGLPNPDDFPYGIDDSDEAVDAAGKPVDIGKHIVITYDWPVHLNSFSDSFYRNGIAASLAGKIAILAENIEPLGDNGTMVRVASSPRIHASQLSALSKLRMTGMRREQGQGLVLIDTKTSAHPDSDYTLISTIRCVNREVQGIRRIAKKYFGKPFSPDRILALNSDIEEYLRSERVLGFNQGTKHTLRYSRNDRIIGKLKVKLRMIPPFTLKAVDIEVSLAADETEL